jgi:hypothetical protein
MNNKEIPVVFDKDLPNGTLVTIVRRNTADPKLEGLKEIGVIIDIKRNFNIMDENNKRIQLASLQYLVLIAGRELAWLPWGWLPTYYSEDV